MSVGDLVNVLWCIGRSLADMALQQGNRVTFYDPDPDVRIPHYLERRIVRLDSLEELMLGSEYVFGSSGRDPFKGQWPMAHRPDVKLFSASSGVKRGARRFEVSPPTWPRRKQQRAAGDPQRETYPSRFAPPPRRHSLKAIQGECL